MDETEQILRLMRRPNLEEIEPVYIEDLSEAILSDMQAEAKKSKPKRIIDTKNPRPR